MYQRILIANRGEIALRIIRACREMGIETVAVFSEGGSRLELLELADEAYCVGPAKASESYLKIANVITAAEVGNVEAIHPGYGFLAENAHFNEICRSCQIDFIGPTPEAMGKLGDKNTARKLARQAGVPVVPGSEGCIERGSRSGASSRTRSVFRCSSRRPPAAAGAACASPRMNWPSSPRFSRPAPKPRPPLATAASTSKSTSNIRGTSKCRSSPTITAMSSTSGNVTAASSGGTRS